MGGGLGLLELFKDAGDGFRGKTGRRFSKDTVRDILQNRNYLGLFRYRQYRRHADGSRNFSALVLWFEGEHAGVIDPTLFELCQPVRTGRRRQRTASAVNRTYLLQDLIYCWHCFQNPPVGKRHRKFGRLRCQGIDQSTLYYRCRSHEQGSLCPEKGVPAEQVENQRPAPAAARDPAANEAQPIT